MKRLLSSGAVTLIGVSMLAGTLFGGTPVNQASERKGEMIEQTVFVTGSLIPQRIKLRRTGTTTVSPVRIIDRREIDWTGRHTTPGVLIADPSVRIIGQ